MDEIVSLEEQRFPGRLQNHYPVAAFWPRQLFESSWLLAFSALLVAATLRLICRSVA